VCERVGVCVREWECVCVRARSCTCVCNESGIKFEYVRESVRERVCGRECVGECECVYECVCNESRIKCEVTMLTIMSRRRKKKNEKIISILKVFIFVDFFY